MTAQPHTPFRKLPGRLRGIGYGASVWMAPDHLLLVTSRMYKEDYRRFYLRDIQAIVVARRPRFVISMRSVIIALLWVIPWIFWVALPDGFGLAWWGVAAALVAAWLIFSFFFSCNCRLYTAVSNHSLPSLYRTWTASKFLDEVKPWIDEVQGRLEENWAEAVEGAAAGPGVPANAPASAAVNAAEAPHAGNSSPACMVLIASLLGAATMDLLSLHKFSSLAMWAVNSLKLVQIASALLVMVQRQRRIIRAPMQRVAIAVLVLQGLLYYVAATSAAFLQPGRFVGVTAFSRLMLPEFALLREIVAAIYVVLAVIGLAVVFQPSQRPPDIIEN
jgi:hypothetical protein